ncbi:MULTISPECIES: dipeptide/oligopeptide/nickel ABC transporter permease/ATP-binding protein [Streptomyces]|uniref:dipeptide/oligopeptide/nickel ABC transporter permease/ATP-binding protein n=1 Tax=Streptomyces TaxID=1883 RepID=UPI00224C9C9A|nr:dipeptide/oligopeptide/nickel ABC transporter permease/ATP-binding protein [Streptomyces sp. NBC_01275]MCX4759681.1 dipeptide/oligopeptide/nickel ABC transporter permease/ATP-binding protein [Streptomyces sp. NBC_01275]
MTVKRLLRNPLGLVGSVALLLIVLFGLCSSFLAPHDPNEARLELTNAPPLTSGFLLGGDQSGRDVLSRLMHATLGTLTASSVMLLVALVLGVTSGLAAGYFGGRLDTVASWVSNTVMALPGLVLLIALYSVIGPSTLTAMAVFGVLIAPSYHRLVRTLVLGVRRELYVDAAKVAGLTDARIIFRHVLRAVRAPVVVQSSFVLSAGIAIQAGLEFLGLGDPTAPSWGGMLQDAFNNIYVARLNVLWPALLITATTLCLVLVGNALRDVLQTAHTQARPLHPKAVARLRAGHRLSAGSTESEAAVRSIASDSASTDVLLSVRDLVVGYPTTDARLKTVVHGVSLELRRGEVLGLVGESGSGKSQTAFSVLGILPRQAVVLGGAVTFDGLDLRDGKVLREVRGKRIGYVPQEPMSNLDPSFTVGAQLSHGLRAVKDISRAQARRELTELLGRVGIKDPRRTFDAYPHQISGGMAQRVLIAGAVATEPDLIIADEPTTALDVTVQAEVLDLIRVLQQERGMAVLLVTHNFGVVADICDRVSVMRQGAVVETNDTEGLFRAPQEAYTRTLLDSMLDGSVVREPWTRSA